MDYPKCQTSTATPAKPGKAGGSPFAFRDKLPKLASAKADVRILLFEQDSVAGDALTDTRQYLDSGAVRSSEMPDVIWWLITGALETENYAHSELIYPYDPNHLADWKAGVVTSNYPR